MSTRRPARFLPFLIAVAILVAPPDVGSYFRAQRQGAPDLYLEVLGGPLPREVARHPPDLEPEKWLDRNKERSEQEMQSFIWGMHALARDLAPQAAAKLDLASAGHLLDLGGGPGRLKGQAAPAGRPGCRLPPRECRR